VGAKLGWRGEGGWSGLNGSLLAKGWGGAGEDALGVGGLWRSVPLSNKLAARRWPEDIELKKRGAAGRVYSVHTKPLGERF